MPAIGEPVARKDGGPEPSGQVINASDQASGSKAEGRPSGIPTIHLADSNCRIRATTAVSAIGRDPPTGGFSLITDDMLDLYERVAVGAKVVVTN